MARQILQQCLDCQAWTLSTKCPECGGTAQAAAPIKWSPEDHRANIRRKMYNVSSMLLGGMNNIQRSLKVGLYKKTN